LGKGTKLTPELQGSICESIRAGLHVIRACQYHRIGRTTYYQWLNRGESGEEPYATFLTEIRKAEADDQKASLELARDLAKKANAWPEPYRRMQSRYPDEWGLNQTISIKTDEQIKAQLLYNTLIETLIGKPLVEDTLAEVSLCEHPGQNKKEIIEGEYKEMPSHSD
jgi:transposase